MYGNWRDNLELTKPAWVHIAIAVALAVLISSLIAIGITPSNSDAARMGTDITNLEAQVSTITGALPGINTRVTASETDIGTLQFQMETAEDDIQALAAITMSPPEGYLTGTFGDYILHAKAGKAGNYTAVVNMVYQPGKAISGINATHHEALASFYSGWVTALDRDYVVSLVCANATQWLVTQVSFNIGTFALEANTEETIEIIVSGLTHAPDYSYVELYPLLSEG